MGAGGAVAWYGSDHLGSVRLLWDTAGDVLGARDFDGFGGITAESGTGLDRYAYAGREWDAALGLQYTRARMYDPATGRFNTEDPLGFAAGDANLYRYVGNGPTDSSDPSGLADWRRAWDAITGSPGQGPLHTYGEIVDSFLPEIAAAGDWLFGPLMGDGSGFDLLGLLDSIGAGADHYKRVCHRLKEGDVAGAARKELVFQVGLATQGDFGESDPIARAGQWVRASDPEEFAAGRKSQPAAVFFTQAALFAVPMPHPLPARLGPAGRAPGLFAEAGAARMAAEGRAAQNAAREPILTEGIVAPDTTGRLLANYPSGRIRDWAIQPGREREVEAWVRALEAEYTRLTGHTVQVVPGGPAAVYGEMSTTTGRITIFHGEQFGGVVSGGRPLTMRDGGILWDGGTVAQPVRGVSAYRLEELYHWFQVRDWGLAGRQNIPAHIRRAIEDEAGEFMRAAGAVPLR